MFDPTTMPIFNIQIFNKEIGVPMRYADKRFLSTDPQDADESGSMVCVLTTDRYEDLYDRSATKPTIDGSVCIRDCYSKPVSIDVSVRSPAGLERRLAKLDTMIDMLTKMKEKLPVMYADAVENGKRWLEEHKDDEPKPRSVLDELGIDTTED